MVRKVAYLCGLAGLLCGGIAPAQESPPPAAAPVPHGPYPTEAFAELPQLEAPSLSPDGTRVAAKIAIKGKQYFAVIPLEGDAKPSMIEVGESDLNWWQWVNDDWLVIGIGQLIRVESDQWYVTRAVSVSADGKKTNKLYSPDAAQRADDLIWMARDGSPRVMMAAQTSIYYGEDGFFPSIDEYDVSTGRRHAVMASKAEVWNWYADASGFIRMGIGMTADGRTRRLFYREPGKSNFHEIDRAQGRDDTLTVPSLFLREPGKALTVADDPDGYSALYELDLATLQRGKQLFATKGYDIGGLIVDGSGQELLGVRTYQEGPGVHWIDPALAKMAGEISAAIKGGTGEIYSLSRDRNIAIVRVGGPASPGSYFLYNAADKSMRALSRNNQAIGMRRVHPVRTIHYKARDGVDIAAVLTMPAGKATNLPLIVMPHGGPSARDDEEWDWWAQFLADRGYAVIQPNYRGSTGYGTKFLRMGEGQWGLAMQDDLNDAVTALAAQGIADPKRVCMVGASYGGYAAIRAAQRDGKLYRCAVSYAGVADLNRMIRQDSSFLGSGMRKDWLKGQAPDLKAVSPVNYPGDFSIPLLLFHGAKDRVVEPDQSRVLAKKLKAANKDVTYVEQPLGDHHFTRAEDRLEFLKALEAFLAKHNPV